MCLDAGKKYLKKKKPSENPEGFLYILKIVTYASTSWVLTSSKSLAFFFTVSYITGVAINSEE
jgi:hypothetical protein